MFDWKTWDLLIVYKRMSSGLFKNVFTKLVYKYIFNVYVKTGFGIK